jgi:hypothetical protein
MAGPTVALISQSGTLSQSDLQSYVAPYQAYVDAWLTQQYPGTPGPYDVADKLTAPREVAINGYISWIDEQQRVWKQATNFVGQGFQVRVLGPANQPQTEGKSPREWVDAQTYAHMNALGLRLFG